MAQYTNKIDQVFELCAHLGFTQRDYARMAVAAADQALVKISDQDEIAHLCGIDYRDPFTEEAAQRHGCGASCEQDCTCASEHDSNETLGLSQAVAL